MVTTRSGKATTPSTPPKNSAAKPKRERRERARDMIVCPARKRTPYRPNSDNVLRDFKTPSKRFVTLIVFPYAARSGGYNPRPRYGGDGFYMDRPKPRSNTNDTAQKRQAPTHGTYSPAPSALTPTATHTAPCHLEDGNYVGGHGGGLGDRYGALPGTLGGRGGK